MWWELVQIFVGFGGALVVGYLIWKRKLLPKSWLELHEAEFPYRKGYVSFSFKVLSAVFLLLCLFVWWGTWWMEISATVMVLLAALGGVVAGLVLEAGQRAGASRIRLKEFLKEEPFAGSQLVHLFADNSKREIYTTPTGESYPVGPYCIALSRAATLPADYKWNYGGEFYVRPSDVNMDALREWGSILFQPEKETPVAQPMAYAAEAPQAPYEAPKERTLSEKVLDRIYKRKPPEGG